MIGWQPGRWPSRSRSHLESRHFYGNTFPAGSSPKSTVGGPHYGTTSWDWTPRNAKMAGQPQPPMCNKAHAPHKAANADALADKKNKLRRGGGPAKSKKKKKKRTRYPVKYLGGPRTHIPVKRGLTSLTGIPNVATTFSLVPRYDINSCAIPSCTLYLLLS